MSSTSVSLLVIRSVDIERAHEFYAALGLQFEKHSHPPCGEHYSTIGGDFVFEICRLTTGLPTTSTFIGLIVDSIDDAIESARIHGGKVIQKPKQTEWGVSAIVSDPDGHKIMLTQDPALESRKTIDAPDAI